MKSLENLKPAPGSNKKKKRIGRGIGSGLGKTAGKGHKGQHARKGGKVRPGFEGGQMPLYRRLPKRGFKNPFRVDYNAINVEQLNCFENGTTITLDLLGKSGMVKDLGLPVKLLGKGKLERKLTIKLHKCSRSAVKAVEDAGGKVEGI